MLDSPEQVIEPTAAQATDAPLAPRMRVLHVIGKMDRAGAETMVMNLMRAIDQNEVAFDFLVHTAEKADYDDEITQLGGHIYRVPAFTGLNRSAYRRAVEAFFDSPDHPRYDIVHGHIGSCAPIYLEVARKHGAKAIAHSHSADSATVSLTATAYRLLARPVIKHADYFIGCSYEAGVSRYGREIANSDRFEILRNGFDCNAYRFNPEERQHARAELGVDESELLVGHVGRFSAVKNHSFLLDVFAALKKLRPDARLALAGRGDLEDQVRAKASDLGLAGDVLFLGVREDVPRLLWAFDAFAFPSHYEGQPVALLEAQAAGLPCVIADTIPSIGHVTDNVSVLPLGNADEWAHAIASAAEQGADEGMRKACADAIIEAGFDINTSAERLVERYKNLLGI